MNLTDIRRDNYLKIPDDTPTDRRDAVGKFEKSPLTMEKYLREFGGTGMDKRMEYECPLTKFVEVVRANLQDAEATILTDLKLSSS